MNRSGKISGRTLLHHPAENPNLKARADAGLAADEDIAALGVKDGFGQRQPAANEFVCCCKRTSTDIQFCLLHFTS